MFMQLEGYLLIPHELLHVLGYRLMGKHCEYRWGERYVRVHQPMTRAQRLVGLLFPFVVCILLWLVLLPLPFIGLVLSGNVFLAIILSLFATLPLLYALTSIGDFRQAYWLLRNRPRGSKTPFDLLFWPVTEEDISGTRRLILILLIILGLFYLAFLLFF